MFNQTSGLTLAVSTTDFSRNYPHLTAAQQADPEALRPLLRLPRTPDPVDPDNFAEMMVLRASRISRTLWSAFRGDTGLGSDNFQEWESLSLPDLLKRRVFDDQRLEDPDVMKSLLATIEQGLEYLGTPSEPFFTHWHGDSDMFLMPIRNVSSGQIRGLTLVLGSNPEFDLREEGDEEDATVRSMLAQLKAA